ncbi:MAG TPA: hypothetical protein VMR23_13715 [Candidatus Limnocylindria bacterium]|nr:hypothetical protein [Candidatus Limnocylindria bacterium]
MMELILAPVVLIGLVAAALGWRVLGDRTQDRALAVRADIQAAVDRSLNGESFLAVTVEPESAFHAGRVVLSTPAGYEWLVREAWAPVVQRVPSGYEVVIKHA